ncbi:unnamed protein product [Soboliphyme baturini]|uniref:Dol-P-Glc:Glc(2)Man(9)GlcNAc(2)-PP-Dol alpha-1,2-glucosyltransferase n=1 Tax=Soboliphyme baturini TaxID=241478 RepID=A0A183IY73_9BILA|nr:unnamed protein product [Soboliphyme baturini]
MSLWIHHQIDASVPRPFMDEEFHVDQTKHYCSNDFGYWNPKITTPPGLYLVSYALLRLISSITNLPTVYLCTVSVLRLLNIGLAGLLYLTIVALQRSINHQLSAKDSDRVLLTAANVCMFPILYFFIFLYYTDLLSTLSVLVMYLLLLYDRICLSAMTGGLACTMRQTNIIWCAFCCGITLVDRFNQRLKGLSRLERESQPTNGDWLKMIRTAGFGDVAEAFLRSVMEFVPFMALGLAFSVFVLWNHGIVLGDKGAHQPCFHAVQLFYCVMFLVIFAFPVLFLPRHFFSCLQHIVRHPGAYALLCCGIALAVYACTFEHPYLLADNRHLTFYVWRKWFKRYVAARYLLIPLYVYGFHAVWMSLSRQNSFWRSAYFVAVALVTVPNRLLELRYFIMPYVFWRLHVPILSKKRLVVELLFYTVVNAGVICLFLFRTFKWVGNDDTQRIMF